MICALILAAAATYAEPPRDASGHFAYQEVVHVDAPATELYRRARAWVATAYRSAPDVIKLDDQTGGRLIVHGMLTDLNVFPVDWVSHSWTIEVKDGRYRYLLTDFVLHQTVLNQSNEKPLDSITTHKTRLAKLDDAVAVRCRDMISTLKAAMEKPSPGTDDNW